MVLAAFPGLKGQTGSASGTAGGSRVDFSFPARLGSGKYAVVSLPDNVSPVSLCTDGTVIFRQSGIGSDTIGGRWKSGRIIPLHLPADLGLGANMPFPFVFQTTGNGWVIASFIRMPPGPPSTVTLLWPPGESEPVRLKAPKFPVDGFEPGELVLEPVINAEGKVWAKVAYPGPENEIVAKFVVWDSVFGDPRVLDENGWAVAVAGVNASGTLIGTYTPDPEDPSRAHGFVGDFSHAVDFEPQFINDEGWVVGIRRTASAQNLLWKNGSEVSLPDGAIEGIDRLNNIYGFTPEGRQVMWTTDLNSRMSVPADGSYQAINYIPPVLPEGWTTEVVVIPGDSQSRLGYGTYRDPKDPQADGHTVPALFVPADIVAVASWDGDDQPAGAHSADNTPEERVFRFWANDDDDSGDTGGTDIPDGFGSRANYRDQVVNGTRDLVDFFPVHLDIKQLLTVLPPDGSIKYKLKQADSALNFVYSNLMRERALAYQKELPLTGFGDQFAQKPGEAATHQITAAGFELSSGFLTGIKDNDWGVILVEGRMPTTAALVLVIEQNGSTVAELKLGLRISDVESMYRHVDLTRVPTEYDGSATTPPEAVPPSRTADPGAPWRDSLTNGKYFVFIHGYNIDGQRARGWHAEVFKRLHVLGSKARFVGVTWDGATGIKINGEYLDYHKAVFQAFQTGDKLAEALSFTSGADLTLAAHSLGNLVASHAIQAGAFAPTRYFMINAATPIEAYTGGDATDNMVEHVWKPYASRLYTANWHSLFSSSDHRNTLTWENHFQGTVLKAYNFYSPGDDVVSNAQSEDSASVFTLLFRQGWDFNTGVWKAQELVKGVNWTKSGLALLMDRGQGGWRFNPAWYLVRGQTNSGPITNRRFSSEAGESDVPTGSLKTQPFFLPFLESELFSFNATTASDKAAEKKVQYDVLARGIPSKSYAMAANLVAAFGDRTFDMEASGRTIRQWPTEGHTGEGNQGRWLHSDFKNVALPYVHQMFEAMITRGSLK
jgi:hypothetical protein